MPTVHFIAAAAAALLSATAAGAETMIVTSPTPPSHFIMEHGMDVLLTCIKDRTGGAIDFQVFASGQIASTAGAYDAVKTGLAQIGVVSTSANSDQFPLSQVTMLPGMGDSVPQMIAAYRKVISGDGPMAAELKQSEMMPLSVVFFPPYQLGLKGEKISSINDFIGKKVRVAGGAQSFGLQSLGAIPVQIQAGEAYQAMQQGTIDGYVLSIASVPAYVLEEVTGSISTNINLANAMTFLAIDQKVFDELPADQQKIMVDCGREAEDNLANWMEQRADELGAEFSARGIEVYEFPEDVKAEIEAKLQPVAQDFINRMTDLGRPGQEAYDEYTEALGM